MTVSDAVPTSYWQGLAPPSMSLPAGLVLRSRPDWIWSRLDRGWVAIAVHDRYYRVIRRSFLVALCRWHPDRQRRGGSTRRCVQILRAYQTWKTHETRWYAHWGLQPPTPGEARHPSGT